MLGTKGDMRVGKFNVNNLRSTGFSNQVRSLQRSNSASSLKASNVRSQRVNSVNLRVPNKIKSTAKRNHLKGPSNHIRDKLKSDTNIRKNVPYSALLTEVPMLVGRLEEFLVLEICQDGNKSYLNLSVRGLYSHVIDCITNPHTMVSILHANMQNGSVRSTITSTEGNPAGEVRNMNKVATDWSKARTSTVGHPKSPTLGSMRPNLDSSILRSGDGPPLAPFVLEQTVEKKSPHIPQPVLFDSYAVSDNSKSGPGSNIRQRGRKVSMTPIITDEPVHRRHSNSTRSSSSVHHHQQVTYRERLGGYIHPRDMRRLVTPFSASNEPELIVRRHVMLLNFDPLRAIILRDRLLVLVPDGADSILVSLEQRVRGVMDDVENSIFGSDYVSHGGDVDDASTKMTDRDTGDDLDFKTEQMVEDVIEFGEVFHPYVDTNDQNATNFVDPRITLKFDAPNNVKSEEKTFRKQDSGSDDCGRQNNKMSVLHSPTIPLSKAFATATRQFDPKRRSYENLPALDIGNLKANENPIEREAETVKEQESEDDSDADEFDEIEAREWINLPFELQCVDAVLFVVGNILTEEINELQTDALDCIQGLLTHDNAGLNYDDPLFVIRSIKDSVRELTSRVKGFIQSMNRILDEDEDMALMNLSRLLTHPTRFIQPVPQEVLEEESDEPELLLEANLQIALTQMNTLDLVQGQIDTASELVDQKLDALRNRLLFANMVISVFTLCVATAAIVGGLLGMNLDNKIDQDPNAFRQVTYGTIGGTFLMAIICLVILYYSGTMPRVSFQRTKFSNAKRISR